MPNEQEFRAGWLVSLLKVSSNCSIAQVDIAPLQKALIWSLLGPGMKRAKLGYYSSQCHFIRWHSFL